MPEELCIRCRRPTGMWQNDMYPHNLGVVCKYCQRVEGQISRLEAEVERLRTAVVHAKTFLDALRLDSGIGHVLRDFEKVAFQELDAHLGEALGLESESSGEVE